MSRKNNSAVAEIKERLQDGTLSVFEKERYKSYLETMAKFPKYSANNQLLIHMQNPNATMVCGYSDWKKKQRQVLKGEKGIKVLAPNKRKEKVEVTDANGNPVFDANGNPVTKTREKFIGFRVATIFDVSQTIGEPVNSITSLFSGDVDGYPAILEALKCASPCTVAFSPDAIGSEFIPGSNKIVVPTGLSQQQTIQQLLPAVASAMIYDDGGVIYSRESVEAESVAYIVAKHFKVDVDYDFDYIAEYSGGKSLEELTAAIKNINKAAGNMIKSIEGSLATA